MGSQAKAGKGGRQLGGPSVGLLPTGRAHMGWQKVVSVFAGPIVTPGAPPCGTPRTHLSLPAKGGLRADSISFYICINQWKGCDGGKNLIHKFTNKPVSLVCLAWDRVLNI